MRATGEHVNAFGAPFACLGVHFGSLEGLAWEAFGKSEDMEPWQWPESTEIGGCGAVLCIIHDFIIMLLQIPMAHQFALH